MSDLLREEFEAWFSVNAPDINNLAAARVAKHMMIKELAFLTWQASRDSLVIELPESVTNSGTAYIETVRKFIEKQGVKTK